MTLILIVPVATQTNNGYPAKVTGIDLTAPHCLRGTINTYGAVKIAMRRTLSELSRGTGEGCNLNITTSEMADVVARFATNHTSSVPVRRLRAVTG
jgi:hypothetical protein